MVSSQTFKWRHFKAEIILLLAHSLAPYVGAGSLVNVRWYLKYPLSYRNLEEMMKDRGLKVDHSTIARWVLTYSPQIDERTRYHLKLTNDSWKVDVLAEKKFLDSIFGIAAL